MTPVVIIIGCVGGQALGYVKDVFDLGVQVAAPFEMGYDQGVVELKDFPETESLL